MDNDDSTPEGTPTPAPGARRGAGQGRGAAQEGGEGTLRLRQVQARYQRAAQLDNERRAEAMKREIAMDVLKAIANGEVRQAQRYAAAALGMEIPRPQASPEQQAARAARRARRGEDVTREMTDEQRARVAERRERREARERSNAESGES